MSSIESVHPDKKFVMLKSYVMHVKYYFWLIKSEGAVISQNDAANHFDIVWCPFA